LFNLLSFFFSEIFKFTGSTLREIVLGECPTGVTMCTTQPTERLPP